MGRYTFDLATPSDDAELRRILRATPMPGKSRSRFNASRVTLTAPWSAARSNRSSSAVTVNLNKRSALVVVVFATDTLTDIRGP